MDELYRKWKVFADNYIRLNMNGTRAYKATYGEHLSDEVAATAAGRLLRKVQVTEYLAERFKEAHMTADELLARYAEQARGEYANYITPQGVDVKRLIGDGKAHLIQKLSYNQSGKPVIEFHNVQHAMDKIGEAIGLFRSQEQSIQINVVGLDQLIDRIYGSNNDNPGGQ